MDAFANPWRGHGLPADRLPSDLPFPAADAGPPLALLARCPAAAATPLTQAPALAGRFGLAGLAVKDERGRMGLGSFKALGAAYVIAHLAAAAGGRLEGETFATASAGNHGLSVAAGARVFGARAVVFIAASVPESFAARLAAEGAEVVRAGADYAASMAAAERSAAQNGWTLLSDSSWPGYVELPHRLMEGYLVMAQEIAEAAEEPPSHVFLQAGVGGMAAAVAALLRRAWGEAPHIAVVEPALAPALIESVRAGRPVVSEGGESAMGRLDCKEPSLIALAGLARDADSFLTITEEEAAAALPVLAAAGFETSASGGAGLAALMALAEHADADSDRARVRELLGLGPRSRALCILSEGA
ncbi:pyridoxal-phosphate dependent enzyme [Oceaniglobus roseus]|uniref:pyridoxal-phosphate dependent enzyme n=1 Tax=Oceaniglobus roseus TaxID=1737570 RepID=UPI000C7F514E|nr:pyridoxal-phosphate dependent enzyme [Kandeliimicrobium roseum]